MSTRNSPYYQAGLKDGAAQAALSPRVRTGYDPAKARSWMYRRGFARAFLVRRRLARAGIINDQPAIIAAMQAGLDEVWQLVDERTARP